MATAGCRSDLFNMSSPNDDCPISIQRSCTNNLISLAGDKRHDIYLQLMGGYFHKGTKKADKNVEITFTIVDGEGKQIPVS